MKKNVLLKIVLFIFLTCNLMWPLPSDAEGINGLSKGQTIYVPVYSHIYFGDHEKPFLLTVTVSIRNIDPKNKITITGVDYYESQGRILEKKLTAPVILNPLESIRYVIPEKDKTGGSGANFMVEWEAGQPVNPPIVESIMIGAKSGQGISFTSRGQVIVTSKK